MLVGQHVFGVKALQQATPDEGAPDAPTHASLQLGHGALWRDGKRYLLDYQKKRAVLQPHRAVDTEPLAVTCVDTVYVISLWTTG